MLGVPLPSYQAVIPGNRPRASLLWGGRADLEKYRKYFVSVKIITLPAKKLTKTIFNDSKIEQRSNIVKYYYNVKNKYIIF